MKHFAKRAKGWVLLCLFLCLSIIGFSQSETHDFITYDTLWKSGSVNIMMTISRPANMFTAGHADTASRPVFITRPGAGENNADTTVLKANNRLYGPHYWMNNGWDGGIQLGNGKHYPIIITWSTNAANIRPNVVYAWMTYVLNTYHIKRNSVHVAGFSEGAFTWGRYICYKNPTNPEGPMSTITSAVFLQGQADACCMSGFPVADNWGYSGYGIWAEKYNGKFFGLEGTGDGRNVWIPRDTIANRGYGANAYFSYEKLGGGGHCCWNSMYNPSSKDWRCVAPITNTTVIGTSGAHANSMGTYKDGSSVFDWMLRQGDTTLVGLAPLNSNAGPDQTIYLPTSATNLVGTASTGSITSYAWSYTSGPSTPAITNASTATATASALVAGSYVFRLIVGDGIATDTDYVSINVIAANLPPTVEAGANRTIYLPQDSVHISGSALDADGTIASYLWTKQSGGTANITSPASASTAITALTTGTYIFRLTATDDDAATGYDSLIVTVLDTSAALKKINVNVFGGTNPYANTAWNNWNITSNSSISALKYEDGSTSAYSVAQTYHVGGGAYTMPCADNGASYGGVMCPPEVLRYASYTTVGRVLTFSGLDVNKTYNLSFYASRSNVNNSSTFISQGDTVNVVTDGNLTNAAVLSGLTPNGSGVISVIVARGVGGTYTYVNGFVIEEAAGSSARGISSSVASHELIVAKDENAEKLDIYPNPGTDFLNLILRNKQQGTVSVTFTNSAGQAVKTISLTKPEGQFSKQLDVKGLRAGTYVIRVSMKGYSAVKQFIKL